VLIATDFDSASDAAVEVGAMLARDAAAEVHLLCVLEALMYSPLDIAERAAKDHELHPEASRNMARTVRRVQALGVEQVETALEFGIAADVIVRYASSGRFDLLVLGHRGRSTSSSAALLRASIPVLVVPTRRA
jgi:nucleotide-binding universal stress UspA family protein